MTETIPQLMDIMARIPAALVETLTWAWHHPGAVGVIAVCGAAAGLYGFVSTRFHRKGR